LLLRTCHMETMPRIRPMSAVKPHEKMPRMPKTSEAMANPLVGNGRAEGGMYAGAEAAMGGTAGPNKEANSGKSPSAFHSPLSDWALVCALTRPWVIHC